MSLDYRLLARSTALVGITGVTGLAVVGVTAAIFDPQPSPKVSAPPIAVAAPAPAPTPVVASADPRPAAAPAKAPPTMTDEALFTPPKGLSAQQKAAWEEGDDYVDTMCSRSTPSDEADCQISQHRFPLEYVNALSGDYLAQNNTAYALDHAEGVRPNTLQACAWRLVMMASGSPHLDDIAAQETDQICDKLEPAARAAATRRAHALEHRIATAGLRPVAVPEISYDPAKGGDEETQ